MKIISPDDTTHTIRMIPRSTPCSSLDLVFFNEFLRTSETIANTFYMENGYLYMTFDLTVSELAKYSIKIQDQDGLIIYRGKIQCTSQPSQTFNPTNNVYSS
jgi:hypothetical protein